MDFPTDPNVIVGLSRADDAGVYKISPELAIIQTVDFFTPVVDDPYRFGQIAAANALSDIYAMGGTPKTAMNLVAFPVDDMDISVLRRIIEGGVDKMKEAGVVLLGGHSVADKELKYGLSVTGFVHPDRVLTKGNHRPGDRLILTKPLGTGIINTAIKAGLATDAVAEQATREMAGLNKEAAEIMARYPVTACTDITGFGLLGHLAEMLGRDEHGILVHAEQIPIIPGTLDFANMGLVPAGAYRNREFREQDIDMGTNIPRNLQDILFDPQTSGGLLMAVAPESSDDLMGDLKAAGITKAAIVGEIIDNPPGKITVR